MSAWDDSRLGGNTGYRFALGMWDPRHKLASSAWMPPLRERRKIAGLVRYVYVLNFTLSPNQVETQRFTITSDFWWTDTIASTDTVGGLYTIQLFDTKNKVRYMNLPLPNTSYNGGDFSGQQLDPLISPQQEAIHANPIWNFPYIQRRIDRIPAGTTMLTRVQAQGGLENFDTQICLGGYTR